MRAAWLATLTLLAVALTAGCDDSDVPATPRALAYVAAEHLGEPEYATGIAMPYFLAFRGEYVGAQLRTGVGADSDSDPGDAVFVLVGTEYDGEDPTSCEDREPYPYCAPLEGGGALTWTPEDPEEDPGHVVVAVRKGDVTVAVVLTGPVITEDPRTADLPVTVDQLAEVARDDRVGLTTTRAAVDAGEAIDFWEDELGDGG